MQKQLRVVYQLGKKVGSGMENNCHIKTNEDNSQSIIKIPNWFGKVWQTQGKKFVEKCLEALREEDINTIQTTIHENILTVFQNGKEKQQSTILEQPYIENIEQLTIDYSHLTNEELEALIKETLIELIHKADKLYREKQLGLDLLGGETLHDLMKGIYQTLKLKIANIAPKAIGERIKNSVPGIRGEIRNLIMQEQGEIILIDPGMHDFSKYGKLKFLTKTIHHVSIATLIELIKIIDPEYDTTKLPYNGPKHIKYISKKAIRMCVPLFEIHKKRSEVHKKRSEVHKKRSEELPPLLIFQPIQENKTPRNRPKSTDL